MNKVQLKIDTDAETKQRVEAAAAEKKLSVNEYLLAVVQQQLTTNDRVASNALSTKDEAIQLMNEIHALRESILARRNGELIDVDSILDLVRDERDAELYDLR